MKINKGIKNFKLLEQLYQETIDSENVFATLVQSDRHPRHQKYFERRLIKQRQNSKIILEEIKTVKYNYIPTTLNQEHHIYNKMLSQLLEKNIEGFDVDNLLIEKEQHLISYYQKVLEESILPEVTRAKLQAQAEDLNSNLQNMHLNLGIAKIKETEYM